MISVDVEGVDKIIADLEKLDPRTAKTVISKAMADAAKKVLKPKVAAATPWPKYRKAVSAGQAKRDKPAAIVKYNAKKAPFRHIMLGGSKAHSTRRKRTGKSDIQAFSDGGVQRFSRGHHVSGVKGTPVIDQVVDRYGDAVLEHVADVIADQFDLDK